MEKQIEKFARVCAVFGLLVLNVNPNFVKVIKGDYYMLVGIFRLYNDYELIKSLQLVYSAFREFEQGKLRETQ